MNSRALVLKKFQDIRNALNDSAFDGLENRYKQHITIVAIEVSLASIMCKNMLLSLDQERIFQQTKSNPRHAGRKPFSFLFMFEILFLERRLKLTDKEMAARLVSDTLIRKILDISNTQVPKSKTIWKYKNLFAKNGIMEQAFNVVLSTAHFFLPSEYTEYFCSSIIVDSTFVNVPKFSCLTKNEEKLIKQGKGDSLWQGQKKRYHIDIDARFAKKRNKTYFGYKCNAIADSATKIVVSFEVTPANVHDVKSINSLIDKLSYDKSIDLYGDSAYVGDKIQKQLKSQGVTTYICNRPYKNKPLNTSQKQFNRFVSLTRSRVEHVFGIIKKSLGGFYCSNIGLCRVSSFVACSLLIFNIERIRDIFLKNLPSFVT